MVYHVNDHLATVSGLLYELNAKLDEAQRLQEMLDRIATYPQEQVLSKEIVDYIGEYTGMEGFSATMTAVATVGKILEKLKEIVSRIAAILKEIFLVLFNSQYRCRKEFIRIGQNFIALASDTDAVSRFESIPCSVLSQADACEATLKSTHLINLIHLASKCTDNNAIDDLMDTFCSIAAVVPEGKDSLRDVLTAMAAKKFGSFAEAGWDVRGVQEAINKHINCISGIESLKDTQREMDAQAKKLDREITDAMYKNNSVELVQGLQIGVAVCRRLTKLIGSAIDILVVRTGAITTILKAINVEATKVMSKES